MELTRAVGENIKRIRKTKKRSMERLAAEAGVSRSMLGQIERGEANPSVALLGKLASALKVPADVLLENDDFQSLLLARELDLSVLRRSRVYVDSLLSMPQATGDLLIPIQEGSYRMEDIAGELGGVLTGSCPGRAGGDRETITLFDSCGLAMEDIGAALAALQAAEGTPFLF